jgi:hypothetical protein
MNSLGLLTEKCCGLELPILATLENAATALGRRLHVASV